MRLPSFRIPRNPAVVLWSTVVFAVLHVLGFFFPVRLWGADFLAYYPPLHGALLVGSLGLLLVAVSHRSIAVGIDVIARRFARWLSGGSAGSLWSKLGLISLFSAVAWMCRVRLHSLGDSSRRIGDLTRLADVEGSLLAHVFADSSLNSEILDVLIHFWAYQFGQRYGEISAAETYAYISCLAGAAYVAVVWGISGHLGRTKLERLSHSACCLALGSVQLFFGYAESYTLVTLGGACYILFALRALAGASIMPAVACLQVASALHAMALALLPSLCYLLWIKLGRPVRSLRRSALLVLVGGGMGLGLYGYKAFYPLQMPLWIPAQEGTYAMFSIRHLLLLFNALLLVSPFGLVWGVLAAIRGAAFGPTVCFLAWATGGTGILIFCHDAYLGGRDWDLLSFAGPFCTFWGLGCIGLLSERRILQRQLRLVVLPAMVWHTALWIGINSDGERALGRAENLLRDSNQSLHYRHFVLGHHYAERGEAHFDRAMGYFRAALVALDEGGDDYGKHAARYRKRLGAVLVRAKRYEKAVAVFDSAYAEGTGEIVYERDLYFLEHRIIACMESGNQLYRARRLEEALHLWERAAGYARDLLAVRESSPAYRRLGLLLDLLGARREAVRAFAQSLEFEQTVETRAATYQNMARNLEWLGQRDAAIATLRHAVALAPTRTDYRDKLQALVLQSGKGLDAVQQ